MDQPRQGPSRFYRLRRLRNIEIKIEKPAFGGDGIGHVEGKACFVEGALPGETVIAKVLQDKKNFIKAKTVKVLESSPFRVEPPCPYYGVCGGCQYQHVSYAEELRIKESQVREMAVRLGLPGDLVKSIAHSSKDYRYRNSVTLHRSTQKGPQADSLGFIGCDNHSVIPIKDCLLVDERLSPLFQAKFNLKKGLDRVGFKLSYQGELVSDAEDRFIRVKIGQAEFLVNSKGFFQNNLAVTALLTEKVKEWVGAMNPDVFYDLFSGVGTFSLLSAGNVKKIVCVEESKASIDGLRMNFSEQGKTKAEIIQGRTEKVFPKIFVQGQGRVMVCLDPPRQGTERELAEFLRACENIDSLVYVSCDLATLSRDLQIILNSGHYEIKEIAPFDMFPRTKHIETAVLLINRPQ